MFCDYSKYVLSVDIIEIDGDDFVIVYWGRVFGCFRYFNFSIVIWNGISRICRICINNVDLFLLGNGKIFLVRERVMIVFVFIYFRRER